MEEDIEQVKEFIHKTAIYYIGMPSALTNILNELDRLQKENTCLKKEIDEAYNYVIGYENLKEENEELKEQVNMFDVAYSGVINESKKWFDIAHDSIPKQVIRDKIDELTKEISKLENKGLWNEPFDTIKRNRFVNYINILKELLGE